MEDYLTKKLQQLTGEHFYVSGGDGEVRIYGPNILPKFIIKDEIRVKGKIDVPAGWLKKMIAAIEYLQEDDAFIELKHHRKELTEEEIKRKITKAKKEGKTEILIKGKADDEILFHLHQEGYIAYDCWHNLKQRLFIAWWN